MSSSVCRHGRRPRWFPTTAVTSCRRRTSQRPHRHWRSPTLALALALARPSLEPGALPQACQGRIQRNHPRLPVIVRTYPCDAHLARNTDDDALQLLSHFIRLQPIQYSVPGLGPGPESGAGPGPIYGQDPTHFTLSLSLVPPYRDIDGQE